MPLLITLLLGLFFLIGVLIVKLSGDRQVVEHIAISIALGALIALLIFDLIPELFESYGFERIYLAIVFTAVGFVLLKLLDEFVPEHDAHDEQNDESMAHIGTMASIAITLHNIIEGMTVYNIAARDLSAGVSLGVGIGLHNIPMGMLVFATLKHERAVKRYVLSIVAIISTFIGGLWIYLLNDVLTDNILNAFVGITAGMVIFIVFCELIPSLINDKRKALTLIYSFLGVLLVAVSTLL